MTLRNLTSLLAVAVVIPFCAGALAESVPLAERLPADTTVPSAGLPAGTLGWQIAAGDNAVVMLGASSGTGCVMYAWVKRLGEDGLPHWEWDGAVNPPGMPASSNVPSAQRVIVSNRGDTFLVTRSTSSIVAIRRGVSGWEYLGSVPTPSATTIRGAISEDTVARYTSSSTADRLFTLFRRQPDNTWIQTWQQPIPLGTVYSVTNLSIDGDALVVSGYIGNFFPSPIGLIGLERIPISAEGAFGTPVPLSAPNTATWQLGWSVAVDDGWIASRHVPLGATTVGTVWHHPERSGTAVVQSPPASDEQPRAMRHSHMVTSRGLWTRDSGDVWRRGADLASDSCLMAGADCVALTAQFALSVWTNPFDLDGDGLDDATAIAQSIVPDCNRNGVPDSADIARGLLADANLNGIPDACESDCDGDGVADLTQIREGAPAACNSTTVLASCAIAAGAADANSDGVVDSCGPDTDGNGVPDATSIANGVVPDCNDDGLPDAIPFYRFTTQTTSSYYSNTAGAPASDTLLALWYRTDSDHRVINGISFKMWSAWFNQSQGSPPPACDPIGSQYTAFVCSDPNGDGNLSDSEILWVGIGVMGIPPDQYIAVPMVEVTSPGFFVGIRASGFSGSSGGTACGGWVGTTSASSGGTLTDAAGRGWWGLTPTSAGLGAPPDLAALTRTYETPRIRAFSSACQVLGDINGDGIVDGGDLGRLLGSWGTAHLPGADLNQDGSVDGLDLGMLLAAWGNTR